MVERISGGTPEVSSSWAGRELEIENLRLREEASRRSASLARFTHDMRGTLNAIMGFSELLVDGKVGSVSDTQKEFLGDILTSARHLSALIDMAAELCL